MIARKMGVKGLYTYLRGYRRDIYTQTISSQSKLRIGIDAMSMLYKYKSSYEEIYLTVKELLEQGHRILFVFDGKSPVEKEAEVRERREARNDASTQATSLKEHLTGESNLSVKEREILEYSVARLEFQGWHMTREIRHAFQKGLTALGVPYIKAIHEADDVLTDMAISGKLDVVVSSDMDFILSGVDRLWIPFRKSYDGFEEVITKEILKEETLTQASLLDAGILCGVEPLRGRVSMNTSVAFNWIRYYKSIEGILNSRVKEPQLDILRDPSILESARAHFAAKPWNSRIRPDHLEKCKEFLEAL